MITFLISNTEITEETENAKTFYAKGTASIQDLNAALQMFDNISAFCETAIFEVSGHETIDLKKTSGITLPQSVSEIAFKIEIDKSMQDGFPVFHLAAFKRSFCNAFNSMDTFFGYFNAILNKPILVELNVSPFNTFVDTDNKIKIGFLSKSISQLKKADITIAPSQVVFSDVRLDDEVWNFFNSILSFYSLLFLSSQVEKHTTSTIDITIDGYRELGFSFSPDEVFEKFGKALVYHQVVCWVFSDTPGKPDHLQKQIYSERLGIARNILSLELSSGDKGTILEPSESVFRKCRSNFNVYLKSKTKEYFDLRMKLDEHVDKLSKSLSDEVGIFVTGFRTNMYGFISIIFTSLLIQATKIDTQKPFLTSNNSVSFIIAIYGAFNLLLLLITSGKLYYSMGNVQGEEAYLIERYGKLLDPQDVQESVKGVIENRLRRSRWLFGLIALSWVLLSAILIFNGPLFEWFATETVPVQSDTSKEKLKRQSGAANLIHPTRTFSSPRK